MPGTSFAKGHKVRLALSSGYWPLLWPSAETPVIALAAADCVLRLPVRAIGDEPEVCFDPPGDLPESNFEELRPAGDSREIRTEDDGTVVVEFSDDMGLARARENGLETGNTVRHSFWIKPDDPLSARAEAAWEFETRRGDWEVTTRTSSVMHADATTFYLSAKLEAFENGELVFERTWDEAIERDGV